MHKHHLAAAAALVVAASLSLAACGGSDSGTTMGGMRSTTQSSNTSMMSTFNDSDVTFATDMISHHRQAVEMASLANTRAKSPEVKALAAQIKAAQAPEIQTMSGWLTNWKKPIPDQMSGMDMSGTMPGMMSSADLKTLKDSSGTDFDQMFLTMMITHHQGAIEMAKTEQKDGTSADATALAKKIEAAQTAEIATMQVLLG